MTRSKSRRTRKRSKKGGFPFSKFTQEKLQGLPFAGKKGFLSKDSHLKKLGMEGDCALMLRKHSNAAYRISVEEQKMARSKMRKYDGRTGLVGPTSKNITQARFNLGCDKGQGADYLIHKLEEGPGKPRGKYVGGTANKFVPTRMDNAEWVEDAELTKLKAKYLKDTPNDKIKADAKADAEWEEMGRKLAKAMRAKLLPYIDEDKYVLEGEVGSFAGNKDDQGRVTLFWEGVGTAGATFQGNGQGMEDEASVKAVVDAYDKLFSEDSGFPIGEQLAARAKYLGLEGNIAADCEQDDFKKRKGTFCDTWTKAKAKAAKAVTAAAVTGALFLKNKGKKAAAAAAGGRRRRKKSRKKRRKSKRKSRRKRKKSRKRRRRR
jgi:hypothetical protein